MKDTARAASRLGRNVVTGFTGSSIWHKLYFFPPTRRRLTRLPGLRREVEFILDVFDEEGVRFAFEVHPTEISYDIHSAQRALEAIDHREAFGFNFDPSHLYWQFVDPAKFIYRFPERIYHAHMKDALGLSTARVASFPRTLLRRPPQGLGLPIGRTRGVDFEAWIRALNRIGYDGPLSVEWEDAGMDRVHGARESAAFVRRLDFEPAAVAFDAAFGRE